MRYIKRGIAMVVAFTMVLAWSVTTLAAGDANDNLVAANAGATQAEVDSALTILRYAQAGLTEKEESNLTVVIIVAVAAVILLGIVAAVFVTLFVGKKKKEAAASPRSTYPGGAPICQFHGFFPKPGHRKTGGGEDLCRNIGCIWRCDKQFIVGVRAHWSKDSQGRYTYWYIPDTNPPETTHNQEVEMWAHYFSFTMTGNTEAINSMNVYLPGTMKQYDQMLKDMQIQVEKENEES